VIKNLLTQENRVWLRFRSNSRLLNKCILKAKKVH